MLVIFPALEGIDDLLDGAYRVLEVVDDGPDHGPDQAQAFRLFQLVDKGGADLAEALHGEAGKVEAHFGYDDDDLLETRRVNLREHGIFRRADPGRSGRVLEQCNFPEEIARLQEAQGFLSAPAALL